MNRRGISSASLLVAAAGLASASPALGAILNWASAVTGTASTAARWSPAQVPTAADDLVFNATAGAQAFTVTFDATTPTSRTMAFSEDTITLVMSSPHTTTTSINLGTTAGDNSTVSLTSGTWTSSANSATAFNIANVGSTTAVLNVSGNNSDLVLSAAAGRLRVGNFGNGSLNITNQGSVNIGEHLSIATSTGSSGALTVSGALASPPFGRSTLISNGTSTESNLGSSGAATVNISNGALADFAGDVEIARASSSSATVTVAGAGGLFDATLDVATHLYVGANGSAGLVPGTGTLTVNNNGQVLVGNTLHVGDDPDGGSGTLNINTGALVSAVNVIDGPFGAINHSGGTLRINGGTYTGHADPLVVSGTGGPTLQLSSNLSKTIAPAGAVGLIVGDDLGAGTFSGNLTIDSGADLILSGVSKDINIGDDAGTTGTITVTGAGSRLVANQPGDDIRVGFNGTGTLNIAAGAQVLANNVLVPALSTSGPGRMDILDGGSSMTTANLAVGHASGTGTGLVQLTDANTLSVTNPGIGTVIRATGRITVTGPATLSNTGTLLVDGGALQVHGTVAAGVLVDVNTGTLISGSNSSSTPLVDAPVHVRSGGAVEVNADDLTMGKTTGTDPLLFDSGSTITVGSARVLTLLDNNTIDANGAITLQGGTIVYNDASPLVMSGGASDQLSGFGTIDANLNTNTFGTCTPTGSGLVFLRDVTLNGAFNATGTAIRFGANSVLSEIGGPHVLNCKVTADAGSVMRPNLGNTGAFGPVTLGDGSTAGATVNGTIHLGTNGNLTFNDSNGVFLGTLTDMNGGTLTSINGLRVDAGEVLRGNGSINVTSSTGTGLFIPTGTIDPDAYNSATDTYEGIGRFDIDGHFSLQTAGTYLCDLAGFDNEFRPLNDRITCNDRVFLAGSTLVVSLINGYVPTQCDTFTILTGASFSGQFATVIKPRNVVVVYNPTNVQVIVSGCLADMDDGSFTGTPDCGVTIDDLLYFLFVFEAGTLEADVDDGSFTGTRDDGVTIDDLLYFLFRFEAGC